MWVTVEPGADVTTVRFGGDIDAFAANEISAAVDEALDVPAIRALELDMSAVTFMDSYGMYMSIIRTAELTDKAEITLSVVANPAVRTVLETAGVADHLEVVEPGPG